jgi:hypothetical protein
MNISNISTIEDILCFFISIQKITNGLYDSWYYAQANRGRPYTYIFSFLNLGRIAFNGTQILNLEASAKCSSLQELVNGATSLEGMAKLLFKIRPSLTALYAGYIQSQGQRDNGLQYCYTFINPLAGTTAFGGISGSIKLNNCLFNEYQERCRCVQYSVIIV